MLLTPFSRPADSVGEISVEWQLDWVLQLSTPEIQSKDATGRYIERRDRQMLSHWERLKWQNHVDARNADNH
jgi:hypothetical protein